MTPLTPCLKATVTVARPLRPGMVTVPSCLIPGVAKTRDTESYASIADEYAPLALSTTVLKLCR